MQGPLLLSMQFQYVAFDLAAFGPLPRARSRLAASIQMPSKPDEAWATT